MFTILPFFIAGFFFPVWPWGVVAAALIMPLIMLNNAPRFAELWAAEKPIVIQMLVQSVVGSLIMNGGAMLLGNGARWLFGAS